MMNEPEIIPPGRRPQTAQRSWPSAYARFLGSPHEPRVLKILPLVVVGVIPLSVLDDFVLPILGVVDDVPTILLAIGTLAITAYRVNRYR